MFRTLLSALSPAGRRARLSIFIFHRVLPERDPLFPGEVTRADFDAICGWLRAWCNVMPLGHAARALKEGTLPSRAAAITFDDGYADNHAQAAPVLAKHGLPATFFIASGFLDGGRMWNDTVIEAIRGCRASQLDLSATCAAALGALPLQTDDQRREAIGTIIAGTKYLEPAERIRWVDAVACCCGTPLPDDLMMSSGQVLALHRAGHTIGAHTVNHPILQSMKRPSALREVAESRRMLEDIIGGAVALFAYPNGKPNSDYGAEAVEIVRELGFDAACSTASRAACIGDDVHQLPRYTPWERSKARFGMRMARTLLAG